MQLRVGAAEPEREDADMTTEAGDIVAQADQAEKSAEHTGRIIAGFHRGLTKDSKVSEVTARNITTLYAAKLLGLAKTDLKGGD